MRSQDEIFADVFDGVFEDLSETAASSRSVVDLSGRPAELFPDNFQDHRSQSALQMGDTPPWTLPSCAVPISESPYFFGPRFPPHASVTSVPVPEKEECETESPPRKRSKKNLDPSYMTTLEEPILQTCPTCGASFKTVSNLNVHARIHSSFLRFACTLCPKRFRHSSSLVRFCLHCSCCYAVMNPPVCAGRPS